MTEEEPIRSKRVLSPEEGERIMRATFSEKVEDLYRRTMPMSKGSSQASVEHLLEIENGMSLAVSRLRQGEAVYLVTEGDRVYFDLETYAQEIKDGKMTMGDFTRPHRSRQRRRR